MESKKTFLAHIKHFTKNPLLSSMAGCVIETLMLTRWVRGKFPLIWNNGVLCGTQHQVLTDCWRRRGFLLGLPAPTIYARMRVFPTGVLCFPLSMRLKFLCRSLARLKLTALSPLSRQIPAFCALLELSLLIIQKLISLGSNSCLAGRRVSWVLIVTFLTKS